MVEVRRASCYSDLLSCSFVRYIDLALALVSIWERSKSVEDTEKIVKRLLPVNEGEESSYRVVYAVHRLQESESNVTECRSQPTEHQKIPAEFIGLVNLKSLDAGSLVLPEEFTVPAAAPPTTLTIEIAYSFLPFGWGQGYATESLQAVFESCERARSFWTPFLKLHIRSIVSGRNLASLRVMEKTGMVKKGIYDWTGEAVFITGEWRESESLHIFGMDLLW